MPRRVALLALLLASLAIGCATTPERTGLLAESANVRATETEVWIRLDNFAARFIRTIELAADDVRRRSEDPALRRTALEWKINASSAVMQTTSHPDAVVAIFDTWTLLYQFRNYAASEAFGQLAGEFQPGLVAVFDGSVAEYDGMVRAMTVTGDAPEARAFVQKFADAHPFHRGGLRPTVLDEMIATVPTSSRSALASVSSLTKTLETASSRLAIYTDLMPKVARWHAELMLEDPRYANLIDDTHDALADVRVKIDAITDVVAASPALDERFETSVASVVAGLADAVDELERIVNSQRRQVEDIVNAQREMATGFVSSERAAVLDTLSSELDRVTLRIDELTARTVDDASVTAEQIVERAYWRAVRLLVLLFVGVLVLMLVHRFLYRRATP